MNSIKHLNCLSVVKSMNAVNHLTPAAFPGNHCPMHTALSLGSRIKGISTLVIGTAECSYYSRNIPLSSSYSKDGLHWTYLLDSKEIVFGFHDGLINAVKEMDKTGAKVVLLISTCVPELIGEDIESICYQLGPEIGARLIHIPLGNFKCGSYQPGYWKTLLALGGLMKRADKKTKIVNILGRSSIETHIPLPQIIIWLDNHSVPLRFLAPDSSLDDFISAGDASLNIILSPFMNPLAEWMKQKLDVPFISLHDIYNVKEIETAYLWLANHLDLKERSKLDDLKKEAQLTEEYALELFHGIKYISANIGAIQPLPLATYLSELGMSPIMIHLEEFYPSDTQWKERLIGNNKDPVICLMLNEPADLPFIKALCADIILGNWGGGTETFPPTIYLLDLYGWVGYERTIAILSRLTNMISLKKEDSVNGTL